MNDYKQQSAIKFITLSMSAVILAACAAPKYGPVVQDLSVQARVSERITTTHGANAANASVTPKWAQQNTQTVTASPAPAVTVTAQPLTSTAQAVAIEKPTKAPKVENVQSATLVAMVEKPITTATAPRKPILAPVQNLPSSDKAVVEELLAAADQLKAQGKITQAVIQLQRAQRIAPRDPKVYARLAALQLSLGEASRAEQLALKGLTLVPEQKNYQYYFWKLIAASRSHLGDSAGESKAIEAAARYK